MQSQVPVPGCTGTTMRELQSAHGLQFLEVNIERGGEVPLHTHDCAATMIVTRGVAYKLTENGKGEQVKQGDVIVKAAKEPHGFTSVGEEGFQFISLSDNGGIVHQGGKLDMAFV